MGELRRQGQRAVRIMLFSIIGIPLLLSVPCLLGMLFYALQLK
jgi:hypothetical protein